MEEILFEGEIIKAVAKELGMEEYKIQHHLKFFKQFIKDTVNSDEVHSLQLPHLGTMYRNVKGSAHMNTYISCMGLEEKHQKKFDKNERDIRNILEKLRSFENFSHHNAKRRIHNPYFTCTKNKQELEEFQNNA